MLGRLTSAVVRGLLVALVVLTPALLLPGVGPDTTEVVALVAVFAALLTTVEYASGYPSIIEFRDAPPFNRIRYLALLISLVLISVASRTPNDANALSDFIAAIGTLIGQLIDFPYSPVRLMLLMLPESASPAEFEMLRVAAGLSYLISLMSLVAFVIVLRFAHWPRGIVSFNVWVNLPTFDPTAGADVVQRLRRDAWANILLGCLLPFVIPIAIRAGATLFDPVQFSSPHTLVWTVAAWAFLPASLLMRGVAMARIADMIAERRRRGGKSGAEMVAA